MLLFFLAALAVSPSLAVEFGGVISKDTTWTAASSPHHLTGPVTVEKGVTLTIEPGASVYLGANVDLVVTNGGCLLAQGTAVAPIRFTRPPDTRTRWGGIVVMGGPNSPESRFAHAFVQGNDFTAIYSQRGTLTVSNVFFATRDRQYLSLDQSSFLVTDCHFAGTTGEFEPVHGSGGLKPGGRGIFQRCFFGSSDGYSDIIDFTGGSRDKGQPILQILNNVFAGSTDDEVDLDGTDAWIERNIFLHTHKNGAPDTASAISGGNNRRDTSEITVIGNLFYDCDQAATAKEGNFFTLINNTIVRMTKTGGLDTADGAICAQDLDPSPTRYGAGVYLEGNIVVDVKQLVRNYVSNETVVTFNGNLLPTPWAGPGTGNVIADPKLKYIPQLSETKFTNWAGAQILREWFSLQPGSPALGAGPNGRDMGGIVKPGASISGEPKGTTDQKSATLIVGVNRAGHGIPAAFWPKGSGYTHYKWRLDGGAWSEETPVQTPIALTALADGPHYVEVIGKRDSGIYQNDPDLGPDAVVTRSQSWTVKAKN